MQNYFALLLTFLSGFYAAFAGITVSQPQLTDTLAPVLYMHAYNEIRLRGLLSGDRAIIGIIPVRIGTGNIIAYVPARKGSDTLAVIRGSRVVFRQIYRIDSLPDPIPAIGSVSRNTATLEQILADPQLTIKFPNALYHGSWRVLSYVIEFKSRTLKGLQIAQHSQRFTKESMALISKLKKGDQLIFEEIRAIGIDGGARLFHPVTITIK